MSMVHCVHLLFYFSPLHLRIRIHPIHVQGITPTLIIVRMGLGLKPQDAAVFSTGPTFNEAPSRWDRPSVDPESQHASVLTIEIQREVDVENGGSGVATDRRATGAGDDEPFALESFHRKGQGKPSGL